jgi:hypothetical protein
LKEAKELHSTPVESYDLLSPPSGPPPAILT